MSVETKAEMNGMVAAGRAVAISLRKMREYARPIILTVENGI